MNETLKSNNGEGSILLNEPMKRRRMSKYNRQFIFLIKALVYVEKVVNTGCIKCCAFQTYYVHQYVECECRVLAHSDFKEPCVGVRSLSGYTFND